MTTRHGVILSQCEGPAVWAAYHNRFTDKVPICPYCLPSCQRSIGNVYIMASRSKTLYIGVSGRIEARVWEHRRDDRSGFANRYRCHRLVYFERHADPIGAIAREKQLKGWLRTRKIALIEAFNPSWMDLSEGWGKPLVS